MNREVQLAELVESLYMAMLQPAEWSRFLDLVSQTFAAEVCAFVDYNLREPQHAISVIHGFDQDQIRRYEEHYAGCNVWVSEGRDQLRSGHVVLGEQLCPRHRFEKSEYYNDFLRPSGVDHLLGSPIVGDAERFNALSILRSRRTGPFGPDEAALLQHLVPHLKRVAEIQRRIGAVDTTRNPLAELADRLDEGLLLLDGRGRIRFANRCARATLGRADVLVHADEGLRARHPEFDGRFQRLLQAVRRPPRLGAPGAGGSLALPRPGARAPVVVLVAPARPSGCWLDGATTTTAVFIRDSERKSPPPAERLRSAFGLAPAEAGFALRLAAGQGLTEAAAADSVTLGTARSRLKSIFQKTDTHSQGQLVSLVLRASLPGNDFSPPRER